MSLDDKAWQTSLFRTHLGLVATPSHPSLSFPTLLFVSPTRATQPSSPSTAPIHQRAAITCCSSVIDCFSWADVLAYRTLRKWQIRSLCSFMIMGVLFFLYISVYLMQVCVVLYKKHFSWLCTSREGEKKKRRRAGCKEGVQKCKKSEHIKLLLF